MVKRIVLFAYASFGYQSVEYIHRKQEYQLLVVAGPLDKGESVNDWKSVVSYCRENNISLVLNPEKKIMSTVIEKVISFKPDIIICCSYPLIIPGAILNAVKYGGLNFHGGLLPHYRGCLSSVWSILNGEKETGVSLHYMDEEIDTGEIIEIRKIPILPSDTAFSLYEKVTQESFDLFKRLISRLPNLTKYKQDKRIGVYYNRKLPHDGKINFTWSTEYLCRFVRAMYFPPFDPAVGIIGNKEIYIESCLPSDIGRNNDFSPGQIIRESANSVIISTGDGSICSSKYNWK